MVGRRTWRVTPNKDVNQSSSQDVMACGVRSTSTDAQVSFLLRQGGYVLHSVYLFVCYAPDQGALRDDAVWRLSDVWRLSRTSRRRAACAAGRLHGAYWLIGPGSAGLAQGCRCALPLQAWAGHIVAAAHLQLIVCPVFLSVIRITKKLSSNLDEYFGRGAVCD